MMTRKQKTRLKWILAEFFAIALAAFYIYPIFLMVNNSLKPFREVIMDVIALPSRLAVENYVNVVERMNYGALFMNNVIITVVGLLGIIVFSSIAAYTINRTRNRYTRIAHFLIITPC
jgi:raffinose/stachyose/melibiose transport system permease protein